MLLEPVYRPNLPPNLREQVSSEGGALRMPVMEEISLDRRTLLERDLELVEVSVEDNSPMISGED